MNKSKPHWLFFLHFFDFFARGEVSPNMSLYKEQVIPLGWGKMPGPAGAGRGLQWWVVLLLLFSAKGQVIPLGLGQDAGAGRGLHCWVVLLLFSATGQVIPLGLGQDAGPAGAGRGLQWWVVLLFVLLLLSANEQVIPLGLGQDAGAGAGRGLH